LSNKLHVVCGASVSSTQKQVGGKKMLPGNVAPNQSWEEEGTISVVDAPTTLGFAALGGNRANKNLHPA
jgi:hypothetical protein